MPITGISDRFKITRWLITLKELRRQGNRGQERETVWLPVVPPRASTSAYHEQAFDCFTCHCPILLFSSECGSLQHKKREVYKYSATSVTSFLTSSSCDVTLATSTWSHHYWGVMVLTGQYWVSSSLPVDGGEPDRLLLRIHNRWCAAVTHLSSEEDKILMPESNFVTHNRKKSCPQGDGTNDEPRGYLAGQNNRKTEKKSAGDRAEGNERGQEQTGRDTKAPAATGCQGLPASPQRHQNRNNKMASVFILSKVKMCSGEATFGLKLKSWFFTCVFRFIQKAKEDMARKVGTPSAVIRKQQFENNIDL